MQPGSIFLWFIVSTVMETYSHKEYTSQFITKKRETFNVLCSRLGFFFNKGRILLNFTFAPAIAKQAGFMSNIAMVDNGKSRYWQMFMCSAAATWMEFHTYHSIEEAEATLPCNTMRKFLVSGKERDSLLTRFF